MVSLWRRPRDASILLVRSRPASSSMTTAGVGWGFVVTGQGVVDAPVGREQCRTPTAKLCRSVSAGTWFTGSVMCVSLTPPRLQRRGRVEATQAPGSVRPDRGRCTGGHHRGQGAWSKNPAGLKQPGRPCLLIHAAAKAPAQPSPGPGRPCQ